MKTGGPCMSARPSTAARRATVTELTTGCAPELIEEIGSVAEETADVDEMAVVVDGGQPVPDR
jgi:hypothetical protein